jgi:hypothetical protein
MLRNLIVCGFALAGLLLLTADASALGGKRRSSCSSSCGSSCYYQAPAPCYVPPPPPPPPPPAPSYVHQPTYHCAPSCGYVSSSGCGGKKRGCGGKRGCR